MRPRPVILGLALVYVVAILLVGLWPTHVDQNLDMVHRPPTTWLISWFDLTEMQGYRIGEFLANVILFLPLGLFAMLLVRRATFPYVVLGGLVVSSLIEIAQAVARPERTASMSDVISNTLGCALGALLVVLGRSLGRRSSRPRAQRA